MIGAKVNSHSAGKRSSPRFKTKQPIGDVEKFRKAVARRREPVTGAVVPDELAPAKKLDTLRQLATLAEPVNKVGVVIETFPPHKK